MLLAFQTSVQIANEILQTLNSERPSAQRLKTALQHALLSCIVFIKQFFLLLTSFGFTVRNSFTVQRTLALISAMETVGVLYFNILVVKQRHSVEITKLCQVVLLLLFNIG